MQVLRLAWFVIAVRLLPETDLGEVATGLVFFAVFAGIGDLGTTKTVVRHVSADPDLMWPVVRVALFRRVLGGLLSGVVVVAGLWIFGAAVRPVVVALAALAAAASGCTEISFAALRTIAHSRTEQVVLIVERLGFIVVGVGLIEAGGGSTAILVLYVAANVVSGIATTVAVLRRRSPAVSGQRVPSLWDLEARRTALGFALFTVTPRLGPTVLALMVAPAVVAEFSVAYRPAEGVALFALAAGVPLLPILRTHVLADRTRAIERGTAAVVSILGAALAPFVVVFVGWPEPIIWVLSGSSSYGAADHTLPILGAVVFTWNLRGVGESLLYAQEKASTVVRMTGLGLVVTLAVAVPAIEWWGAPGAAVAVLVGEVLMVAYLVAESPVIRSTPVASSITTLALISTSSILALLLSPDDLLRGAIVVATVGLSTIVGLQGLRRLDQASQEDTDV